MGVCTRICCAFGWMLYVGTPALAEEHVPRADLMGVYQQAVLNDARLSAARHAFGAQREAVAQALAGLLPTLSAGATVEAVRLWCGNERFQQPCLTTV